MLTGPSSAKHLIYGRNEVTSRDRRRDPAAENCPVRNVFAIKRGRIGRVLVHFVTGQIDASKQAFATGISKKLSIREFRGGRLRVTANRPRGSRGISTELYLIFKQVIQTLGVHADENEVRGLAARLQAKACPGQLDEYGSAPTCPCPAGSDTLAVLCTDQKCSLLITWDHSDAVSLGSDIERDSLIGSGHQFVKDVMGCLYALTQFFDISGVNGRGKGKTDAHQRSNYHLLHIAISTFICREA